MADLWNALRRRRLLVIVLGVLLAVGLGTSAAIWFARDRPAQAPKTASTANQPDASTRFKPAGFSEFRSEQAGFELAYPSNWTKLSAKDPQVLLLL
ncbi:MAG TPA: hypothetical protein VN327_11335, partial [Pseudonocardiaceae bacterium]|nr:hypothetical protein [Pseudonocardiaceae bacterium]